MTSAPVPPEISPELLPKNEDLILSSAFIEDKQARADVLLLYAFLETLREIPLRAKEPLMGDIRLQWWREAIEEIEAGKPVRYHPINAALEELKGRRNFDLTPLQAMIDAQGGLLDQPLTREAIEAAVEAGEGAIVRIASQILEPGSDASALLPAIRLYGLSTFLGDGGLERQSLTPAEFKALRHAAQKPLSQLPTRLMPLVAHAIMAHDYTTGRAVGPLKRRFKVLWGFLSGRL